MEWSDEDAAFWLAELSSEDWRHMMDEDFNKYCTDEDSSEVAMYACDDQYLPPEMWYAIFRHLTAKQLLPVRLTCRRWRDIVDDRSLLKRTATVTFPVDTEVDGYYEPDGLLPAREARFENSRILALGTWWTPFAANLKELQLNSCKVLFPTFEEMLRVTPNLRILRLYYVDFIGIIVNLPNFHLNMMKHLAFFSTSFDVLGVILGFFPNLKNFRLYYMENNFYDLNQKLVEYVQSVQDTLEGIGTCCDINALTEISKLPRLKLKKLSCSFHKSAISRFLEITLLQPLIERLDLSDMRITNAALCEIGKNLRNLKRISVEIDQQGSSTVASFLRTMPKMEHLGIDGTTSHQMVDFSECRNPNLKILDLYNVHQTQTSWNFLKHSPNILEITLQNCHFDSWSDLLLPINQLKLLRRLNLFDVKTRSYSTNFSLEPWSNLRSLKIRDCNPSKSELLELFHNCPQLRDLHLEGLFNLDDETVLMLCQRLKYLNYLTIDWCPLVKHIGPMHVMNHCHAMIEAKIYGVIIR